MTTTYTLSQYRTWVLNRLGDQSFDSSMLNQFANDVNREICNSQEWPFMKTSYPGTIGTSTNTYNFPAGLLVPINVTVTDPSGKERYLKPKTYEWFDQSYPDPTTLTAAAPDFWVPWGSTFIVGPAFPDATYTLNLRYIFEPTPTTSDSSTLNVPDTYSEVVVLGMLSRALFANDQYDQAQVIAQEYEIKLDAMAKKLLARQRGEAPRISVGRVQRTDW